MVWVIVPAILVGVPFSTLSVRMAKHLHRVPMQLKTFDVQSAACFLAFFWLALMIKI